MNGPITLHGRPGGKPDAGNPHVRFDWAGAGDGVTGRNEAPALCETKLVRNNSSPHHGHRASPRPYDGLRGQAARSVTFLGNQFLDTRSHRRAAQNWLGTPTSVTPAHAGA